METLNIKFRAEKRLGGQAKTSLVGVVASGNCEALFERVLDDHEVEVQVVTPITGYRDLWERVVDSFVERASPGSLRISINDGGATPDVVLLRLLQGAAMMEGK